MLYDICSLCKQIKQSTDNCAIFTCVVGLPDSVTVFAQGTINTMGQHGLPSAGEVGTNRAGDRGSCALRTVVPCSTVVPI